MSKKETNHAFIDAQNTHSGTVHLGWKIDWNKFRIYLKEKYNVKIAYIFIGYICSNKSLYKKLKKAGFVLVFKPTVVDSSGKIKGNCDADLVLHALIKKDQYNNAVIVTSDGDFYSLVRYLLKEDKLKIVLSSHTKNCSGLLKKEAMDKIHYISNLRFKIAFLK